MEKHLDFTNFPWPRSGSKPWPWRPIWSPPSRAFWRSWRRRPPKKHGAEWKDKEKDGILWKWHFSGILWTIDGIYIIMYIYIIIYIYKLFQKKKKGYHQYESFAVIISYLFIYFHVFLLAMFGYQRIAPPQRASGERGMSGDLRLP